MRIVRTCLIGIALLGIIGVFVSARLTDAGTLVCAIRSNSCNAGETTVFKISGTSNAHAELPSQSNYTSLVCCGGVTSIGNSCSGNYVTVLNLENSTNSHVQQNDQSGYTNSVCLSAPSGDPLSLAYQPSNCTGYDTTVVGISGTSNAHVDDGTTYTTKVCATASVATVSCSASISSTDFGTLIVNSFSTSTPDASTTITCDSTTGCTLTIADAGDGSSPGLSTSSPAYLIASVTGTSTLVAGTEGYGVNATSTSGGSGTLNVEKRYARGPNDGAIYGGITLVGNTLASSTASITNKQTLVRHGVSTGSATQNSVYTDTITYSCTIN